MSHPGNEALAEQCTDKAIDELKRVGITEQMITEPVTYDDLVVLVAMRLYEYYMERDII